MPKIGRTFMPGLHRAMRFQMESGDFPVPVLYLKFGENTGTEAKDSSPEGNDGDIEGASWTTGHLGPGLSFEGLDDYVKVDDSASLDIVDALTIAAWCKPSGTYGGLSYPAIVRKRDTYALRYSSVNGSMAFFVWIGGAAKSSNALADAWVADTWVFWTGVYDGSYIRLYKNGVSAVTPVSQTGDIDVTAYNLGIGASAIPSYFYRGVIDEVRIYNEALSAQQIRELYYGIR